MTVFMSYDLVALWVVTQRYQLIYSVQSAGDYVPSYFHRPAVATVWITTQTPVYLAMLYYNFP